MNLKNYILLFIIWLGLFMGCTNPPDYPLEPVIAFEGMTRNSMVQGNLDNDSLTVFFEFTDGDGNLGSSPDEGLIDVFLTDTRDGFVANKYRIPFIPQQGVGNGISGRIALVVYTTCCVVPNYFPCTNSLPDYPTDTVIYEIKIMDRDSNLSNPIFTDPIILQCL